MYKKLEIGVDEYFEKVFLLGGGKKGRIILTGFAVCQIL